MHYLFSNVIVDPDWSSVVACSMVCPRLWTQVLSHFRLAVIAMGQIYLLRQITCFEILAANLCFAEFYKLFEQFVFGSDNIFGVVTLNTFDVGIVNFFTAHHHTFGLLLFLSSHVLEFFEHIIVLHFAHDFTYFFKLFIVCLLFLYPFL